MKYTINFFVVCQKLLYFTRSNSLNHVRENPVDTLRFLSVFLLGSHLRSHYAHNSPNTNNPDFIAHSWRSMRLYQIIKNY